MDFDFYCSQLLEDKDLKIFEEMRDYKGFGITIDLCNIIQSRGYKPVKEFEVFNPLMMIALMEYLYLQAKPYQKKFALLKNENDSFINVLNYIVTIYCRSGHNIDEIVKKSSCPYKNDIIILKGLFDIVTIPQTTYSVTLSRVANALGHYPIHYYRTHNYHGPLPLNSYIATIPCAIKAPAFSSIIPGLFFKMGDNEQYNILDDDRNILIKTSHILACMLDKLLNSPIPGYIVDSQKVLDFIYISYDQGLMNSSTRMDCLIDNEVFTQKSYCKAFCLSKELSLTLKNFCFENLMFTSNVNYSNFNIPPKRDSMTYVEMRKAAISLEKKQFHELQLTGSLQGTSELSKIITLSTSSLSGKIEQATIVDPNILEKALDIVKYQFIKVLGSSSTDHFFETIGQESFGCDLKSTLDAFRRKYKKRRPATINWINAMNDLVEMATKTGEFSVEKVNAAFAILDDILNKPYF